MSIKENRLRINLLFDKIPEYEEIHILMNINNEKADTLRQGQPFMIESASLNVILSLMESSNELLASDRHILL